MHLQDRINVYSSIYSLLRSNEITSLYINVRFNGHFLTGKKPGWQCIHKEWIRGIIKFSPKFLVYSSFE